MRTTITLADDVAAEIQRLRRERGWGPSEALNELARRGMASRGPRTAAAYVPVTAPLGLRVDVSDIGAMLDVLDEADHNGHAEQREHTTPEQS